MVDSVLSTGVQGIQAGFARAQQAATDVARAGTTEPESGETNVDLVEAAVSLLRAEQQVEASAAVVRTADELLGIVIDTKA